MIEVRNLSKSFGDTLIWDNVNLDIRDGETLAIIGRSGCGKSVLMKHLVALLQPDQGTVHIDGEPIFELNYVGLRKVRQKFGVLFQGGALFDSISAKDNVAFPLRFFTNMTEPEIEKQVMHCLGLVGLENIGNKSTAELSGGMRKRVGLARAIVLEPTYLLYDEPTSGLDPETSDEINELINSMSDNLDITSVVITHDMHSVLQVADQVAFLDQQALSWYGTLDEMKKSTHERLLSFIKSSEYQINTSTELHDE